MNAEPIAMSTLRRRFRALEAIIALTAAGILVRTVPFAAISRLIGSVRGVTAADFEKTPVLDPVSRAVGESLARAANQLPWHSTCLVRALAGGIMLRRRGIPTRVVFGVAVKRGGIRGHAWLMADDGIVCGERGRDEFTPIASFGRSAARWR